jgi:hypothetical protein
MATAAEIVPEAETGTDLIVAEAQRNAVALFTDEQKYDEFYKRVRDSVSGFVPDVTTDKGRREVASVAFRVTKAKTTLDKAGLALTEEWRQKTNAVNAARKKMVTQLDALADEIRQPLTEWEQQEAERQARVDDVIQKLRNAATVAEGETAADVEARLKRITEFEPDEAVFQVRIAEARDTRDATAASLERSVLRLRQEEADRVELERLRREAAEREEAERIAREEREREEQERLAREAEERARIEAEERRKAEIAAAEERARVEAEERARAEERRVAEEQLAEERRAREAAEREADERRRAEEERAAWEAKEKREREAREADERHRKAVLAEVAEDIAASLFTAPEKADVAQALANAIAAGNIRHVRVEF